jgi:hypothetical protein
MTTTETATESAPTTKVPGWEEHLAALQDRFPKVKPTILFAFHTLQTDPDIVLDDLRARAEMHGLRVTAATLSAALRLASRNAPTNGKAEEPAPKAAKTKSPRTRQRRPRQAPLDVEGVIRAAVERVQATGDAEAEWLREAIRKAAALLEAAVGD